MSDPENKELKKFHSLITRKLIVINSFSDGFFDNLPIRPENANKRLHRVWKNDQPEEFEIADLEAKREKALEKAARI